MPINPLDLTPELIVASGTLINPRAVDRGLPTGDFYALELQIPDSQIPPSLGVYYITRPNIKSSFSRPAEPTYLRFSVDLDQGQIRFDTRTVHLDRKALEELRAYRDSWKQNQLEGHSGARHESDGLF